MSIRQKSKFGKVENSQECSPASSLHEAIRRNIHPHGFTPEQIARNERISPQFLLNACNKNLPHIKLPLTRGMSIMKFTGDYSILQYMAKDLGFHIFEVPVANDPGREKMLPLIFKVRNQWSKLQKTFELFYSADTGDRELLREIEEQLWIIINLSSQMRVSIFKNIERLRGKNESNSF